MTASLADRQLAAQLGDAERAGLARDLAGGLTRTVQAAAPAARPELARVVAMLASPGFGTDAAVGFVAGFATGFVDGARSWLQELDALFRIAGIGSTVGLAEFFARPLVEVAPQGLSPRTVAAVDTLRSVQRMRPVITWLYQVGPSEAVRTLRELVPTADEVATMIGRAGLDWFGQLVRLAPDATACGRHVGTLAGRVALELLRAFCEPDSLALSLGLSAGAALEISYEDEPAPAGSR
jgi:hypothetical protein